MVVNIMFLGYNDLRNSGIRGGYLMLEIKETTIDDIKSVQQLWADGDVMRFVGFPEGLHETDERMEKWFRWIDSNRPALNHYSIFEDGQYGQ